ncbi:hypothetical protein JS528_00510 [Bifidobacterium sp. MA2]|uniref:Uncharacterized protein n=1 Tax=Bifidobacterium santillanense TaxID=2809028 RepID=A0ABS5ULS6_9BIFI|nr:hypothetical protein [Bifidobacterium santillanense]MBT1171863.1 hypothetical protein [Bifidobacterium santillanense]
MGSPSDAIGYDKYASYQCAEGNSGMLTTCSNIYVLMGGSMAYLPFGYENANAQGEFIPVDENGNGVIDGAEGGPYIDGAPADAVQ